MANEIPNKKNKINTYKRVLYILLYTPIYEKIIVIIICTKKISLKKSTHGHQLFNKKCTFCIFISTRLKNI